MRHQELHAGNSVLSSVLSVLQDIEDIDDVGEDLVAEVSEEILASNPETKSKRETTLVSPISRRQVIILDNIYVLCIVYLCIYSVNISSKLRQNQNFF